MGKSIRWQPLIYLHLIIILYSCTGILAKRASQYEILSPDFLKFYSIELLVIALYAYLWQQIIKKITLTTAYANRGMIIIWNLLWGMLLFNEGIKINHVIGAIIIIGGIIVVTRDDE